MSMQVSEDTAAQMEKIVTALVVMAVLLMVATIGVALFGGSITATWIALNAMQLLAYSVLLQVPQSANATYFGRRLLDLVRLHFQSDLFQIEAGEVADYIRLEAS